MLELLKKGGGSPDIVLDWKTLLEDDDQFARIRCPLCGWQPSASSVWACYAFNTPEPFFGGCGAVWNTFTTRGRCPGCAHQWQWTSCHRCGDWSRHADWYDDGIS